MPMNNDTSKIILPILQFTKTVDETFGESFLDSTMNSAQPTQPQPIYEKKKKEPFQKLEKNMLLLYKNGNVVNVMKC